jgi:hypothetical protein
VLYFLVAAFLLPETKGRTLEQIEAEFGAGRIREAKIKNLPI